MEHIHIYIYMHVYVEALGFGVGVCRKLGETDIEGLGFGVSREKGSILHGIYSHFPY